VFHLSPGRVQERFPHGTVCGLRFLRNGEVLDSTSQLAEGDEVTFIRQAMEGRSFHWFEVVQKTSENHSSKPCGGFLKWGYPQFSSFVFWDFP